MRRGFTLLELIVVIIIIGVLGTLGFTQYAKVVEKGRSAEAKIILGQVRSSQEAYHLEYDAYTSTIGDLAVSVPTICTGSHYFKYSTTNLVGTATRCTTDGKSPNSGTAYTITMTYATSAWGGSSGYY
jgi:prepilin-type N-terminal cleavage/methylation domain-containing protein